MYATIIFSEFMVQWKYLSPVTLVINKVVDDLLILLVLNFHGNRLNCLGVIAVGSLLSDLLIFWTDLDN